MHFSSNSSATSTWIFFHRFQNSFLHMYYPWLTSYMPTTAQEPVSYARWFTAMNVGANCKRLFETSPHIYYVQQVRCIAFHVRDEYHSIY